MPARLARLQMLAQESPRRTIAIVVVAVLLASTLAVAVAFLLLEEPAAPLPPVDAVAMAASLRAMPIAFEPNAGQAPEDVAMVARGNGFVASFGPDAIVLGFPAGGDALRMRLVGASGVAPQGESGREGRSNYFLGPDPARWVVDVPHYERVRYAGVWPGIDLVFYGSGAGGLEYDLVVAPGADPRLPAFAFDGAAAIRLAPDGALEIAVGGQTLRHDAPFAYQTGLGGAVGVESRFVLHADGGVGFEVGRFDRSRALVIDPIIEYSTFVGGAADDFGRAIALDGAGNAYVTGETSSTAYPTTAGAFDTTYNSNKDVFVTKLNATGTGLLYSTFLGGSSDDSGHGIDVDATGAAYVTGSTASSGFPTTAGVHDTTLSGSTDAFATKVAPAGNALTYSTYLGGTDKDEGRAIAVDANGHAYLTGFTESTTGFPQNTTNRIDNDLDGQKDAFLVRLNATATGTVVYGSYIGGTKDDEGLAIAIQPGTTIAYVTGYTESTTGYETTAGAFDTTHNGKDDVFLSKINTSAPSAAAANLFGTFLGGSEDEAGEGVKVDAAGSAYVTGTTESTGYPTTAGSFDTTFNTGKDAFVTKVASLGNALAYSGSLGGTGDDDAFALALDDDGEAHVTGRTKSTNFPVVSAVQATLQGGEDAFVATISSTGAAIVFGTYLGGTANDQGHGIAVDAVDDIYVTGHTASTTFPRVPNPGAFDVTHNGNNDVFVTKISEPRADLRVTKADSPDPVFVNATLHYFVNVTNLGPQNATNVTLVDDLHPNVTFLTATTTAGGPCTHSAGKVTCPIGPLNVSQTAHVNITVRPREPGLVVNVAKVNATQVDPVGANNETSETTTVITSADLAVSKEDSPDPVLVNSTLTYFVNVTNEGPTRATNASMTDELPAGVTFLGVTTDHGTCAESSGVVFCQFGTLQPGQGANVTIQVRPTEPGIIVNPARVNSSDPDPDPNDNETQEQTTVGTLADLGVTKEDSPDPVFVDEPLVYFVNVTNAGPTRATNVTVEDTLPATVTFVGYTSDQGTCSELAGTVLCDVGTMTPGQRVNITITVTPNVPGTIVNDVEVRSADDPDPVGANDTASETTEVVSSADLEIVKEDSPDPVEEGSTLTYWVNVTNHGPTRATNVVVTDTLPAGVTYQSGTPEQGSCSESGGIVTCDLGTIPAGGIVNTTIVVTVNGPGVIVNTAGVQSDDPDPESSNDSDAEPTTVTATPADLRITKEDAPDPVVAGENLTYWLNVTNDGPGDANNVTVEDELPAGATFLEATPSQGTCSESGGVLTCELGTLAPSASASIVVNVSADEVGILTNKANVTADESDPDPADNESTSTTTVVARQADLNVTKSDSPDPVGVGQELTYTIVVRNDGPQNATDVKLRDTVVPAVELVQVTPSQGTCSDTVNPSNLTIVCDLGELDPGANAIVTIVVRPDTPGTLTDTANVSAREADPDPSDNEVVETTTVTEEPAPEADLAVEKSDAPDPVFVGEAVQYTVNVTNVGPDTAENVTLLDAVPAAFAVEGANASQGSCVIDGQLVTCDLGDLDPSELATVTIDVRAREPGTFNNTASATADASDPDPSDNTANATTTVNERPPPPPPPDRPPAPPTGLRCVARDEGNFLDWDPSPHATHYELERTTGTAPFSLLVNTTATEHLDTDVEPGTVYRYRVSASNDAGRSLPSGECVVAAIPDFPTVGALALAVVGMLSVYAILRGRRKEP